MGPQPLRRPPGPSPKRLAFTLLLLAASLLAPWQGHPGAFQSTDSPSSPATAEESWRVDDQGREYRVQAISKKERHLRLDGNRLRVGPGITLDIESEDESSFYVKVYRPASGPPSPSVRTKITPEAEAQVAAGYRFELQRSQTMGFEPFDTGLPRGGQWRYGFVLADMNGDGKLDIVHGPARRRPGPPVIFLGDGAGRWRRWATAFPPQQYDYGHVAVADLNGDGHLDIVMGMHLLGMTALLGDGTGRFKAASQGMDAPDARSGFSSHAVIAVDWDGDGHVDIVALGEGPRLGFRDPKGPDARGLGTSSNGAIVYRNRGDATWEKRQALAAPFGDKLVLARSRPSGRPWLVAGSIQRGRMDLILRPGDPIATEVLAGLRPHSVVRGIAIGDFDGDGAEDIALVYDAFEAGQWRSGVDLLVKRGEGPGERRTLYVQDGARGLTAIDAGDLDQDGRPDLVVLTAKGEVLVLRNTGAGTFTREDVQLTEPVSGCHGYAVQVRDLDGDGRADIVASFSGEPEGLGSLRTLGCPDQGSLRAWRSRPRPAS